MKFLEAPKKHSTEAAVVYRTAYILEHIDRQMVTGAVFIEWKKRLT